VVVFIGFIAISTSLARFIKCRQHQQANSNILSRRNLNQAQQVVYSINTTNNDTLNGSILDYNQALTCSIEIKKDNNNEFKEEKLPSYEDALKMKPNE
jgi:hypothetical protein